MEFIECRILADLENFQDIDVIAELQGWYFNGNPKYQQMKTLKGSLKALSSPAKYGPISAKHPSICLSSLALCLEFSHSGGTA
ncbi:hypothetical protein Y1Q_0001466 [Alligator mississippiensis]|uniref:Uncharacterized protein n=1 Tax=Alligator mississippiensis TaxID=8496 RepID=A0A151M9K9_ALLMI|nr:hypothetical protein Y1Q_0001466 [Alligator mississippiensis]